VIKCIFAIPILLFAISLKAQSLEESLIIISQALGVEISCLIDSAEIVLPDLENYLVDEQNPKPNLRLNKVIALAMAPGVEGRLAHVTVIGKSVSEELFFKKIIEQIKFEASEGSFKYELSPIIEGDRRILVLRYSWKKRIIFVLLESDYFQSVTQGQNLLFQDLWLINQQNYILSHSNKSWFGQKMSDLDQLKDGLTTSQSSGRWNGKIQGKELTLFYQSIPETNLRLIGVQFSKVTTKTQSQLVWAGAILIGVGLIVGLFYLNLRRSGTGELSLHQNQNLADKNCEGQPQFELAEFFNELSSIPVDLEKNQSLLKQSSFKQPYEYVSKQVQLGRFLKCISPWVKIYQDWGKYTKQWVAVRDLYDKLSNIPSLTLDKIHNLISRSDLQYKVSYQAIQNIILALQAFLNEKACPNEITKLLMESNDKDLLIKLNIKAQLNSDDFEWLNWILQHVGNGGIVSNSPNEYEIHFKVDIETRKHPGFAKSDSTQPGKILIPSPTVPSGSSYQDMRVIENLSQEALEEKISILDSTPEIEEANFQIPNKAQEAIRTTQDLNTFYKKPGVLDIPTRIRKPKGNRDVT
jgi:hypothetical protein